LWRTYIGVIREDPRYARGSEASRPLAAKACEGFLEVVGHWLLETDALSRHRMLERQPRRVQERAREAQGPGLVE
jgi:hypothetical protein